MTAKALMCWVLMVLWCALIFWGTGDPHFRGDSTSAVVARAAPSIGLESARQVHGLNVWIRKSAHVLLFGSLAALARKAFGSWPGAGRGGTWGLNRAAGWAWLFTTTYACSDEWHQYFVPGRTASAWDVLLDSAAAVLILLVIRQPSTLLAARCGRCPEPLGTNWLMELWSR